eukprot:scaffold239326_cov39-Prasinocladus_malaysianus.AAC.1
MQSAPNVASDQPTGVGKQHGLETAPERGKLAAVAEESELDEDARERDEDDSVPLGHSELARRVLKGRPSLAPGVIPKPALPKAEIGEARDQSILPEAQALGELKPPGNPPTEPSSPPAGNPEHRCLQPENPGSKEVIDRALPGQPDSSNARGGDMGQANESTAAARPVPPTFAASGATEVPKPSQDKVAAAKIAAANAAARAPATQGAGAGPRPREDDKTVTVKGVRYTKLEVVGRGGSSKVFKLPHCRICSFAIRLSLLISMLIYLQIGSLMWVLYAGFPSIACVVQCATGHRSQSSDLSSETNSAPWAGLGVSFRLRGRDPHASQAAEERQHHPTDRRRGGSLKVVEKEKTIFLVLEYGEIDLATMLARKERLRASGQEPLDENFIRLYWQQMLQASSPSYPRLRHLTAGWAVSTIHDERIVHSDLKPANFIFVKGQLKLLDFGIAKSMQADTTSIVRENQ